MQQARNARAARGPAFKSGQCSLTVQCGLGGPTMRHATLFACVVLCACTVLSTRELTDEPAVRSFAIAARADGVAAAPRVYPT